MGGGRAGGAVPARVRVGLVIEVRRANSDAEAQLHLDTHARVFPGTGTLEGFRHRETTWETIHFVAFLDGEPAGSGWTGPRQQGALWCAASAPCPSFGTAESGSALYAASSGVARDRELDGLFLEVLQSDPESLAWVERRGFLEVERQEALALDLTSLEQAPVDVPDGVEIVTRGARPDLVREMYDVGVEAARDIPGIDGGNDPGFKSWAAFRDRTSESEPELCFIALADGRVVGFASLDVFPEDVFHGLDGRRARVAGARRRGGAQAVADRGRESAGLSAGSQPRANTRPFDAAAEREA